MSPPGLGVGAAIGAMGGRVIGGSSPDLNGIIFKTCKRKGIFLTFVPSRHPKGKRREKEAGGEMGEGHEQGQRLPGEEEWPKRALRTRFFLSPDLLNFLKAPNSKRDSGVHYIELSPLFQAKINLLSLAAPSGEGKRKKMGSEGKKLPEPISSG